MTNNIFAIADENLDTVCIHVDTDIDMFVGVHGEKNLTIIVRTLVIPL